MTNYAYRIWYENFSERFRMEYEIGCWG